MNFNWEIRLRSKFKAQGNYLQILRARCNVLQTLLRVNRYMFIVSDVCRILRCLSLSFPCVVVPVSASPPPPPNFLWPVSVCFLHQSSCSIHFNLILFWRICLAKNAVSMGCLRCIFPLKICWLSFLFTTGYIFCFCLLVLLFVFVGSFSLHLKLPGWPRG